MPVPNSTKTSVPANSPIQTECIEASLRLRFRAPPTVLAYAEYNHRSIYGPTAFSTVHPVAAKSVFAFCLERVILRQQKVPAFAGQGAASDGRSIRSLADNHRSWHPSFLLGSRRSVWES